MVDRKDIQKYLIFRVVIVSRRKCIIDQIAVGKHDSLSPPGRSGCKEDHRTVVFRHVRSDGASGEFFQNIVRAWNMFSVLK